MAAICRTALVLIVLLRCYPTTPLLVSALTSSPTNEKRVACIEVCQNKFCKRNFDNAGSTLPQVVRDLLPPRDAPKITIQETGCLSRCDKGPNMRMFLQKNDQAYELHGVKDHFQLAAALEEFDIDVSSKYLAACTVLEKAHKSSIPEEKQRFLSSVIRSLDVDDLVGNSSVHARALLMRAELILSTGQYEQVRRDVQRVLSMDTASVVVRGRACLAAADAYEQEGKISEAIRSLQQWAAIDPSFRSKISNEIERLRSIL